MAATEIRVMSQRVRIQNMIAQMHEKNLVLVNILRDIVENETTYDLTGVEEDGEDFYRILADKAARRKEILGEIFNFLRKEDMARRVNA